jgi:hypothetical protein
LIEVLDRPLGHNVRHLVDGVNVPAAATARREGAPAAEIVESGEMKRFGHERRDSWGIADTADTKFSA